MESSSRLQEDADMKRERSKEPPVEEWSKNRNEEEEDKATTSQQFYN
jgi:hypothetical protein